MSCHSDGRGADVILYNTRDGKGNDIVKEVEIKAFPLRAAEFRCPVCGGMFSEGVRVKDAVSANFTDWAYLGEYICRECSRMLSLYFYSYEVSPKGIELFNAREASAKILGDHEPPFRLVITVSQKKHLFYKSAINYDADCFSINLEEERIQTTKARMRELFDFVECMITIGQGKRQMADGELSMQTIGKVGFPALEKLQRELRTSREIQIPLFCGQARDISEEDAIKCITTLTRTT